jgi:hypothetical protein
VRDLPPKLEVVVNFAPTAAQMHLLMQLMDIVGNDKNMLRDTEVRAGNPQPPRAASGRAQGRICVSAESNGSPFWGDRE